MAPGPIKQRISLDSSDEDEDVGLEQPDSDEREPEHNLVIIVYHKIANNNWAALTALLVGWGIRASMVKVLLMINNSKSDVNIWVSMLYLLFQRPLFVMGAGISILPFLLKTPVFKPITQLMASTLWYPLARLSYGAYLSHGIFMLFRAYNTEKGVFACEFDAFLFFFAYLTFAFVFSLIITVMVEMPCLRLVDTFIKRSKGSFKDSISASFRSFTSESSSVGEKDLLIDRDGEPYDLAQDKPLKFEE